MMRLGILAHSGIVRVGAALAVILVVSWAARLALELLRARRRLRFRVAVVPCFFTKAESRFYSVLAPIAARLDLVVFSKVGLNDIFVGQRGAERGQYNRYAHMHVDFLLVTAKDYRPVLGIELDGSSHETEIQRERDLRKNAVFKAGGLPLLRFLNDGGETAADILRRLEDALEARRRVKGS